MTLLHKSFETEGRHANAKAQEAVHHDSSGIDHVGEYCFSSHRECQLMEVLGPGLLDILQIM